MEVVAGIDIGGTNTKIGLITKNGESLGDISFSTSDYQNIDDYLDQLTLKIHSLVKKTLKEVTLIGVGIGAPNASSKNGTIENAANLNWKGIVPFVEKLNQRIDLPIKIMNDASAAALGEMLFGKAKNMTDFIAVTLGTGFGGGIVANGKLIDGYDGFAGELGHIDITLGDGRLTGLGVKGGLEAYVSATGLKRTVMHMLAKHMDKSELRTLSYNDLDGEKITKAAENSDPIALRTYKYTGKVLGSALANFVAFTQPEAIFMMGGLVKSGHWIIEPTKKYLEENLLQIYKGKVKLLESGLINKNPAIMGGAALIWNDINLDE